MLSSDWSPVAFLLDMSLERVPPPPKLLSPMLRFILDKHGFKIAEGLLALMQ